MRNRKATLIMLVACLASMGSVVWADTITLPASDDSYVNGSTPSHDANYGASTVTVIRYENDTWGLNRPLYKFDFSALPENVTVNSASIQFYVGLRNWPEEGTNFAPVAIFKNTQDWSESTVTFSNAPTYEASPVEILGRFGWRESNWVDFTGTNTITSGGWLIFSDAATVALVQGWADGTIDNFGISMWGTGDFVDSDRVFRPLTKENSNSSVHSKIIIDYTVCTNDYAGWAAGWGVDIGAETNDYDADGLNNLYEFGLGGDPTNALDQGTAPTFGIADVGGTNYFGYIHPQLADPDSGLAYSLELNTDLVFGTWTNIGYTVMGTNVTGDALDFVTNATDTADNEKFIRLIIK